MKPNTNKNLIDEPIIKHEKNVALFIDYENMIIHYQKEYLKACEIIAGRSFNIDFYDSQKIVAIAQDIYKDEYNQKKFIDNPEMFISKIYDSLYNAKIIQDYVKDIVVAKAFADFDQFPDHAHYLIINHVDVQYVPGSRHVSDVEEKLHYKNSSDIALSLEALEVMLKRSEINDFVIVSGDRDVLPLIFKLKSNKKDVHLFAYERNCSVHLKKAVGKENFYNLSELFSLNRLLNDAQVTEMKHREEITLLYRILDELTYYEDYYESRNSKVGIKGFINLFVKRILRFDFPNIDQTELEQIIEKFTEKNLFTQFFFKNKFGNFQSISINTKSEIFEQYKKARNLKGHEKQK